MRSREAVIRGFGWGVLGGLVLVALMYVAGAVLGLQPLTQALNEPLLSVMPGFVFGFLIDTLQHAGKVLEEAGLIVAMVIALGVLGGAWAWTSLRVEFQHLALVFAGAGWLVTAGVLLPIAGLGFFGLSSGFTTPLVWAALFAVYGVVLQMGGTPTPGPTDLQRRRLLSALPLGVAAASLGLLGWLRLPNWYEAIVHPAEAGLSGPSPEITPVANFYIVSKNTFRDPVVDGQAWKLRVGGMVDKPLELSLSDLRALPSTTEYATLECISNDVGGRLMSTGNFTGVRMSELIARAAPQAAASWVAFKSVDGYTESIPLTLVQGEPAIMIAYDLDSAPLPSAHGFPARVLIPGRYGMKGPKWLVEIDLVDHESGGFWEQQGWDHDAVVRTTARFDIPLDGEIVRMGAISLAGVAFAGTRGISKVEVSTDGGKSWTAATSKPPLSELTWVLWTSSWTPPREGSYQLAVRATDGSGAVQDSTVRPSYPSGASGYHTIRVDVSQ